MTRASLTTVVAFGTAISFLFRSVIIVVLIVIGVIGFVSLREGEITQLKVERV